ncbi:unnamed protein product [Adineta ricciae]|uniref:RNA helicase n=1 Tax=Adineta ricciae TaxID=249248 RepID=A0A815YA95_ADIRI|nr:unnamed protein product [Adineta ricciae]
MSDESRENNSDTTKSTAQQPATTSVPRLGVGRGKPLPATSNDEPKAPSVSTWNAARSNNENNGSSTGGGFGSRSMGFGSRSEFGGGRNDNESNNDGNGRTCYNCQETGHIVRDCPNPRNERRDNNRGGFSSGGSGNRGGFHSGADGNFRSSQYSNSDNQYDNNSSKSAFQSKGSRDERDGGFSSGDRRGGFSSGNREFRGGMNGDNSCFNCKKPGHKSRDCPEERKFRDNGSSGFRSSNGGDRKSDRESDDVFDIPGGRTSAHPTERYIPPAPPTSEDDIFGEATERGANFAKYHEAHVQCTPENIIKPVELYEEADLDTQVLSNIRRANFTEPTAIQRYTIPCIKGQHDLMACAQTGSGKTAAFLIPIISNLLQFHSHEVSQKSTPPSPLCLVLSPTRELALQTEREARKFAFQTPITACSAVGGHDTMAVAARLQEGCHILSATTGRLKDMVEKGRISLKKVKYFVLDEADRMLDTGFEPDIRRLQELGIPPKGERHTSMFSATFPEQVQRLAKAFLREDYIFLVVGTMGGANEDITQSVEEVPQANKKERLFQLLEKNLQSERCLIFVETKRSADYIGSLLSQKKLMSTTMHGDRTQRQRHEAVEQFTNGRCPILVATSVAARGLDFPLIGYVINYDLPDTSDFYIHRIGRTGRAGHLGKSISFFDPDRQSDRQIAPDLVLRLSEAGQEVPEFLQKYAHNNDSNSGFSRSAFGGRNSDMRSGRAAFRGKNQPSGFSGGTASAGAAHVEQWDD